MKTRKLSLFASVALTAGYSHGAVQLQDSYSTGSSSGTATDLGGGTLGYEVTLDPVTEFSAAGHGKLIVVLSGHDANVGGTPNVASVTYNGVALTEAIQDVDNGAIVNAGIFYLDNVATDGALRIELAAASSTTVEFGFGLFAVDGLKTGVQDTGTARANAEVDNGNAVVSMTTNEGFFVQQFARNNQTVEETTDDEYETLYKYDVSSYRGFAQYRVTDAAGDYQAPIGNGGDNFKRIVTAAFEADPAATAELVITSITALGANVFELVLTGGAETAYEFYSASDLDFNSGTLIENLSQGDEISDPGTLSGPNNSILTTDGNGDGKVRVTLSGSPADFLRAQNAQ